MSPKNWQAGSLPLSPLGSPLAIFPYGNTWPRQCVNSQNRKTERRAKDESREKVPIWNVVVVITVVVQSLSYVWLFATPWTAAGQASLSFSVSQRLLRLMSLESVMPSNHLILGCLLLLLPYGNLTVGLTWSTSTLSCLITQGKFCPCTLAFINQSPRSYCQKLLFVLTILWNTMIHSDSVKWNLMNVETGSEHLSGSLKVTQMFQSRAWVSFFHTSLSMMPLSLMFSFPGLSTSIFNY